MWKILIIIAVISLVVSFFREKNAVWGGATIGLIIGVIIAIFQDFNWSILYKAVVIGTLVGTIADILGSLSDYLRK